MFFEKGLHVCRMIHGDFTETTAYSMVQLSDAYLDCDKLPQAASNLEHASTILAALETKTRSDEERQRVTLQLNKATLQLVNLYLMQDRQDDA